VVPESLDLLRDQERWQRAASAKIETGLRDIEVGRTLTELKSRREMEVFKSLAHGAPAIAGMLLHPFRLKSGLRTGGRQAGRGASLNKEPFGVTNEIIEVT